MCIVSFVVVLMAIFQSLVIEAKNFHFSVSSYGLVTFTEWHRKSQCSICFGKYGVVWLANLFGKLVESKESRDLSENFNKLSRTFLAQKCGNKSGRYVALAEFGGRRRQRAVMIPKGKKSEGVDVLCCDL